MPSRMSIPSSPIILFHSIPWQELHVHDRITERVGKNDGCVTSRSEALATFQLTVYIGVYIVYI